MRIEYEYTERNTKKKVNKCYFEPFVKQDDEHFWSNNYELTYISDELREHADPSHSITIRMVPVDKQKE